MNKLIFKFALSFVLLLNALLLFFFYPSAFQLIEPYLYPLFFIYFIVDSFSILIPKYNTDHYSKKMLGIHYKAPPKYDPHKLHIKVKETNRIAGYIFLIYFSGISLIGAGYLTFSWFTKVHLYLLFFAINFADYFCIMLWCPFRSLFLKNSCCNTCRISNWDRLMKFSILIFIPNIFTLSIVAIAVLIFLQWEFLHWKYPERFYRQSNTLLQCTSCDKITCGKQISFKKRPST